MNRYIIVLAAVIAVAAIAVAAMLLFAPSQHVPPPPTPGQPGEQHQPQVYTYTVTTMDSDVLLPLDLSNPELNAPSFGIDILGYGGTNGQMWLRTGVVATFGTSASLSVMKTESIYRLVKLSIEDAIKAVYRKAEELGGSVRKITITVELKGMQAIIDNTASGCGKASFEIKYGSRTASINDLGTVHGKKLWIPINEEYSGSPNELSIKLPTVLYSATIRHNYGWGFSSSVDSKLRDVGIQAHITVKGEIVVVK